MRVIDRQIAFAVVGPFAILDEAEADQIADALHAAAQLIRGQHVTPAGTLEVGQNGANG
jgi:uncharacterized protein (DUF2342 family)